MTASVAAGETRARDPDLPPLHRLGDVIAPKAPQDLAVLKAEDRALADLLVKLAYTVPRFTTDWATKQLNLPLRILDQLLEKLCFEGQVEQLWQTSQSSSHYKITEQGRDQAGRLLNL